jgi:hypothetical protein
MPVRCFAIAANSWLSHRRQAGGVSKSLDITAAAEWFVRMLFSLFMTPSERLDLTDIDTDAVADFMREHVVRGYVEQNRTDRSARTCARRDVRRLE